MLNPEVIVIGGGVIAAGEMLLEPARARDARARAARRRATRCGSSRRRSASEAGMIGAALMAREAGERGERP